MTIIIFFLILSLLVFVHELGHFLVAKKNGVKVEEFGFGLPPRIFGFKKGETTYSINLLPIGGFVKLYGEEYYENDKEVSKDLKKRAFVYKSPLQKASILLAGVFGNFLLGWVLISYLFTQGIPTLADKVIVEKVQDNSPAATVGIKEKDIIYALKANGKTYNIKTSEDLINLTKKYTEKKVEVLVERNTEKKSFTLIPRQKPPAGQGSIGVVITSFVEKKYAWYQAPFYGLKEAFSITSKIVSELFKIVSQLVTFQKPTVDVAGPIAIAKFTGQAVKFGTNATLEFIALLSLNLAVINILPFPALDGGRLVFVIYEAITRKRPNKNFERYLNLIGFVILISLAILISIRDIIKFY